MSRLNAPALDPTQAAKEALVTPYSDHPHQASTQDAPCEYAIPLSKGGTRVCGADWSSVLHPPDQYRHWCEALEEGGDCVHEEIAEMRAEAGAMDEQELVEFENLTDLAEMRRAK